MSGLSENERILLASAKRHHSTEYDGRANAEWHRDNLLVRLDDALARLAEVRALADEWEENECIWSSVPRRLRAVIDAPARDESELIQPIVRKSVGTATHADYGPARDESEGT